MLLLVIRKLLFIFGKKLDCLFWHFFFRVSELTWMIFPRAGVCAVPSQAVLTYVSTTASQQEIAAVVLLGSRAFSCVLRGWTHALPVLETREKALFLKQFSSQYFCSFYCLLIIHTGVALTYCWCKSNLFFNKNNQPDVAIFWAFWSVEWYSTNSNSRNELNYDWIIPFWICFQFKLDFLSLTKVVLSPDLKYLYSGTLHALFGNW